MFSKEDFLKALEMQCKTFNSLSGQVWKIADNVFAAMIRSLEKRDIEWTVIFYFDDREVKLRDEQSHKQHMARELQLLMMGGFAFGSLSEDPNDHVRIAYFEDDPTGCNSEYVINYASQLFAKTDNGEVKWFDSAELIPFSMVGK